MSQICHCMLFLLLGFLFYVKSKMVLKRWVMDWLLIMVLYRDDFTWNVSNFSLYIVYVVGFFILLKIKDGFEKLGDDCWFWWIVEMILGFFFYIYLTEINIMHVKNYGLDDIYTLCSFWLFESRIELNIWHVFIQSREE